MRFINKDPDVVPRVATMQVMSLGLSRCATSSIQAAFDSDTIGCAPCMHMEHIAPYADREQLVLDALRLPEGSRERQKLLHRVFDGYGATADFPAWVVASDLMDMYPDAPIVLNMRQNGRVWAESARASLQIFGTMWYLLPCLLWKTDRLHWRMHQETYRNTRDRTGLPAMFSAEFYEKHNDWVRAEAAKRNRPLLEWYPGDGWAPLCEFLGKPMPSDGTPFPHLNDAKVMRTVKLIVFTRGVVTWAFWGAVAWGAWKYAPGILQKYW
jgi:hypothetical protein